jgi:uncharacterized DUF497 family protein
MWYNGYTGLRFHFDPRKDRKLRKDSGRGVGFGEAEEIFQHRYYLSFRSEIPEQFCATGWVKGKLYSLVYERRGRILPIRDSLASNERRNNSI